MLKCRLRTVAAALALALCAAATAAAQQPAAQPQQPRPTPADNYVDHKEFQTMLFTVRHRDPDTLLPVLRLLTSGFKGAAVSADRNFRVVTVRDFAENVASIGDAIKRLDTPEGERPDVELRIHVLIASNTETPANPLPADLRDVVTQLKSTLNYKNYDMLTAIVQRTKESRGTNPGHIQGGGSAVIELPGNPKVMQYGFQANSLSLTTSPSGAGVVNLGDFGFTLNGDFGQARVVSDVSVREGEKVVVGTAGMRDRALVLVLTAKLIK